MQGNVAEVIRELMEIQQLSVRKVSAKIAEKHGGSVHGYTQQVSRILNDSNYDPTLSTVQKILSALNVSFWQLSRAAETSQSVDLQQFAFRLEQLSSDVADIKLSIAELREVIQKAVSAGIPEQKLTK